MKTIRKLREERGWSQFRLAIEAGVTPGTVGNWERAKSEPKASQLRRLAGVFGVPMDAIAIEPPPRTLQVVMHPAPVSPPTMVNVHTVPAPETPPHMVWVRHVEKEEE
jgi:transcriptional regulator with XRE-family HTH domain